MAVWQTPLCSCIRQLPVTVSCASNRHQKETHLSLCTILMLWCWMKLKQSSRIPSTAHCTQLEGSRYYIRFICVSYEQPEIRKVIYSLSLHCIHMHNNIIYSLSEFPDKFMTAFFSSFSVWQIVISYYVFNTVPITRLSVSTLILLSISNDEWKRPWSIIPKCRNPKMKLPSWPKAVKWYVYEYCRYFFILVAENFDIWWELYK